MTTHLEPLCFTRQALMGAATMALAIASVLAARTASADYEAANVENGGTIDGYVTFSGATSGTALKITKNRDVCGTSIPDPSFTVDSEGRLGNVIVYLKDITKGKAGNTVAISLTSDKCMMNPRVQGTMVGATITMSSNDEILHNIHSQDTRNNATLFNVALPFKGVSVTKVLPSNSGLIKVKSDAQEWMHAWIMQFEHPYYVTTARDGHFSIKDIPPGTYTLVAWHEVMGELAVPVVVVAGHTAAPVIAFTERSVSARASTIKTRVNDQPSI